MDDWGKKLRCFFGVENCQKLNVFSLFLLFLSSCSSFFLFSSFSLPFLFSSSLFIPSDSEDFQPVVPGTVAAEEEDLALKKARV